ncbi:hypothetical protein FLL65_17425 [Vibrio cholerae]|uniref:DUF6602 domain-containing protein n=1 Tax=Vibrio cholerae TaxID=666 RepID=UPI00115BFADC|nr:DUF6602 domain-containing protein [Vibrio cholerae]TQO99254.1 hypothetical protein FLL97_14850 [Vibrio cholerae]TQP87199.1 hypothetical protein FLL74_12925 [Vibrio cholerae]TQQ44726.1 hypothetical protein FLL65_17425 [Vibrio cholerae]
MSKRKYFEYIVNLIDSAKREANFLASDIDHHGIAGQIREIALNKCIAPFLTHSFKCGTGKIIDTEGNLSDQIDLIVYHSKLAPALMINSELGIFPAECCAYAIEVKSTLTATEVKDSIKKGRSVRNLKLFPHSDESGNKAFRNSWVRNVLFAFSSDIKGNEIERYLKYDDASTPAYIAICVLGKGYWFWSELDGKYQWFGSDRLCCVIVNSRSTAA